MALKEFELKWIEPPTLKFAKGKKSKFPLEGLKNHGPFDLESRPFKKLKVFIVSPNFAKKYLDKFLQIAEKLADEMLKIKLEVVDILCLEKFQYRNVANYLNEVDKKLENINKDELNVVLQILGARSTKREDNPYFELRKRMLGREGIAVQSITVSNLSGKRLKAKIGNVLLGMYAKSGGKPWQLAEPVSSLYEKTIYLGYDISLIEGARRVGTTIVYDNKGQLIYSTPIDIPVVGEIIKSSHIKSYIRHALIDITKNGNEIDTVVVHRDGEIHNEEIIGINSAVKEFNNKTKTIIISIPKTGVPPLFIQFEDNKYGLADNGYYFFTGYKNKQPTFFLQTYGFEPLKFLSQEEYKKHSMETRVVNMLQYRVAKLSNNLLQEMKEDISSLYHDIARQIFFLSRLNWGSGFGKARTPVTIHYAHKASKLLTSGINPRNIRWDKLWMI